MCELSVALLCTSFWTDEAATATRLKAATLAVRSTVPFALNIGHDSPCTVLTEGFYMSLYVACNFIELLWWVLVGSQEGFPAKNCRKCLGTGRGLWLGINSRRATNGVTALNSPKAASVLLWHREVSAGQLQKSSPLPSCLTYRAPFGPLASPQRYFAQGRQVLCPLAHQRQGLPGEPRC